MLNGPHCASYFPYLQRQESQREQRWARRSSATEVKLRWRAFAVQHCFHVVPGERILELGAGTGLWTESLSRTLRHENPITAVSFSPENAERGRARRIPNVHFITTTNLDDLPDESFDYVVGCRMLCQEQLPELLASIYRLLKPGGQTLFFESNLRFPGRRIWRKLSGMVRKDQAPQFAASVEQVAYACSHQGFTHIDIKPYDLLPVWLGERALRGLQAKTLLIEHAPVAQNFCTDMFVWTRKPGPVSRSLPNLATHPALYDSVSVVVPCHNEAPNLHRLVARLLQCYGPYIHEIVLVNDNSVDDTAEVAAQLSAAEPRVRVINRSKPNGVGLALRDGYRAATGSYILSMDCDFLEIVSDFRALFDKVAEGYDGAIGSRFSHDSILVNYPFLKLLGNRAVHALIRLFLTYVRDVTNNLKLYRADIFKDMEIESPHFSANLETGLKPLLAGYRLKEVPISWINRTVGMGNSSFDISKVAFDYWRALYRIWRKQREDGGSGPFSRNRAATQTGVQPGLQPSRRSTAHVVQGE